MWLIAGALPDESEPLYIGDPASPVQIKNDTLLLSDGRELPVIRGTAALAAAASLACEALGVAPPRLLLAGDCGSGAGSKLTYQWLAKNLPALVARDNLEGITFHYFFPDVDSHNRVYLAIENLAAKPVLVADAGYMYVAKMSGFAASYDLFTPDLGELAFLADEKAPHPFYTRGFLSAGEGSVAELLERALKNGNCPANMIVKGKIDHIVCDGKITASVAEPAVAAMECIGGTGDIVTGFATAFLAAHYPVCESALLAAETARELARFCNPNPSSQAASLIGQIKPMFRTWNMKQK